MLKMLRQIWHDPVWSKVIAGVIIAFLAAIWAGLHFDWWPGLHSTYPIPFWLLVMLIGLTLVGFGLLLWKQQQLRKRTKEHALPELEANITKIDLTVPTEDKNKGLTFPLKCYVQLRNDSALTCADVRISEYRPGAVTLKSFVLDVLQLRLREWLPKDHGVDRPAVLPGQLFRAWIGVDDTKCNAGQVNNLRGRIGTLVFLVNGKRSPPFGGLHDCCGEEST